MMKQWKCFYIYCSIVLVRLEEQSNKRNSSEYHEGLSVRNEIIVRDADMNLNATRFEEFFFFSFLT